jgi:hypothetical protein
MRKATISTFISIESCLSLSHVLYMNEALHRYVKILRRASGLQGPLGRSHAAKFEYKGLNIFKGYDYLLLEYIRIACITGENG